MTATSVLGLVAVSGAAVAALGYLAKTLSHGIGGAVSVTKKMLNAADVILGTEEHPSLATRLDTIEHELRTNNGSSLRDVADRVEDVAKALHHDARANAEESKLRRAEDRAAITAISARVDAIWNATTPHRREGDT